MVATRKKAVFNWSGGKDSALALLKVLHSDEYEIISLLTTVNGDSKRSTLHGIPEVLLQAQADSIGLPLYKVGLTPEGDSNDYADAMRKAVAFFKAQGVTHFIFGDIFLQDVRSYREERLAPYGIQVVEPLWGKTSGEIMEDFLASGLKTVVVTTMAGLLGVEYIGRLIDRNFVDLLPASVDVCGENGEYHTWCYDGPLFSYPVAFQLGKPYGFSHEMEGEDHSCQRFSYWCAAINE